MRALKMLRTKLIATMALTLLSGGTAAIAQNQGAGSSGAASSTIPEAPIGHRQPRADGTMAMGTIVPRTAPAVLWRRSKPQAGVANG
jgi:hypothetical protein